MNGWMGGGGSFTDTGNTVSHLLRLHRGGMRTVSMRAHPVQMVLSPLYETPPKIVRVNSMQVTIQGQLLGVCVPIGI